MKRFAGLLMAVATTCALALAGMASFPWGGRIW
jgi:hypothetical protein